jgi:hypothetical protein
MMTTPCWTLASAPVAPDPPLLGAGIAVLGSGAGLSAPLPGWAEADEFAAGW